MQAGKIISQWAQDGAKKVGSIHGYMCKDCAFRAGSDANTNDPVAVETAMECVGYEQNKFGCHTTDENGNHIGSGKLCAGYLYALEKFKE